MEGGGERRCKVESLYNVQKNSVLNSSLVVFYLLHGNVLEVTTDLEMTAISIL